MDPVDIVEDVSDPPGSSRGGPVCYLLERDDEAGIRGRLTRLGRSADDLATHLTPRGTHVDIREVEDSVIVTMYGLSPTAEAVPWVFLAAPLGLVIIGDLGQTAEIRSAVEASGSGGTRVALAAGLLGLARSVASTLETLSTHGPDGLGPQRRLSGADERSRLRQLRARLFELQETFAAQSHLLDDDEELIDLLGVEARSRLGRARSIFNFCRGTCARLYAVAGDVLTEQTALVNERLTLVSTFFLPLTASTGFFGMNFGWMTDRVGSAAAFVVLGLVVPLLLSLLTLGVVRRLGADGP